MFLSALKQKKKTFYTGRIAEEVLTRAFDYDGQQMKKGKKTLTKREINNIEVSS